MTLEQISESESYFLESYSVPTLTNPFNEFPQPVFVSKIQKFNFSLYVFCSALSSLPQVIILQNRKGNLVLHYYEG